jgi:RND superfamily putative drug exporter
MASAPHISASRVRADGLVARIVTAVARGSARIPKTVVFLWLLFVVGCVAAGTIAGTHDVTDAQNGLGDSGRADALVRAAHLADPASEDVLLRSRSAAATRTAVAAVTARTRRLHQVASVRGPAQDPHLVTDGGRTALVVVTLRGDPANAETRAQAVAGVVAAVQAAHPAVRLQQTGDGTMSRAVNDMVAQDLHRAELVSLPITLIILVLAFGALVAAVLPLLLGITSVAAALGVSTALSQYVPLSNSTSSLVVLIGLAVGVDYSLFYVRREREGRRAGLGTHAALQAAADAAAAPSSCPA